MDYQLTQPQARTLRIALNQSLEVYGIHMVGETPTTRKRGLALEGYAETSLIDGMVREYIRLSRYILGGKHYNQDVGYNPPTQRSN